MSKITIEEKTFNLKDIKQLYPAVIIKTGYENETTEMSLEWIEIESKGRVDIVGYGIYIITSDKEKHVFKYETKEQLDVAIGKLATQINK